MFALFAEKNSNSYCQILLESSMKCMPRNKICDGKRVGNMNHLRKFYGSNM